MKYDIMQKPTLKLIILFLFSTSLLAQDSNTKDINFSLKKSTIKPQPQYNDQPVSLFACNTIITNKKRKNWKQAPKGLKWNTKNQIFTNLPYGQQIDSATKKPYYVSKYYIASPPVFLRKPNNTKPDTTRYDIGIVKPNEFVFSKNNSTQNVFMDYDLLQLMQIKYIPVKFDSYFSELGVNIVPFKVEAKNFPFLKSKNKGASGVGSLNKNISHLKKLFLPYYHSQLTTNQEVHFLDFEVSILNDILFHHKIYFMVNGKKSETINLKEFYENSNDKKNLQISLCCEYSEKLGCGCTKQD